MRFVSRLVVAGLALLACAGSRADEPAPADAAVRQFYALASESGGARAEQYIRSLPAAQRLPLARAILWDRDARIGYAGASVLIGEGHADEAVPALAAMLADGRVASDQVRFGYDWAHSPDESLYPRMTVKIGRYLLAHLAGYGERERARAEEYLMGGPQPFSRTAAERRLADVEAALAKKPN